MSERRTCSICGHAITAGRRRDTRYCSVRCKLRAQRNRGAQVKKTVELARETAASLRPSVSVLGGDDWMNPGFSVGERVRFAQSFHPTIAKLVGDSVLRAAARYDLGCRWHLALADARIHRTKTPVYDAVHRELLGEPCDRCKTALRTAADQRKGVMAALVASVNAGRQSPGRRRSAPRSLAASGPTSHDPFGTCFCAKRLTADGRPVQVPPHPWFGSRGAYEAWVRAGRPRKGR